MFDTRGIATILAALLFWSEEISPSGNDTARHYLKSVKMAGIEPLTVLEIQRLSTRLRRSHRQK
ncbi:MAG: hypothetical protein JWN70_5475 [Planctomycetaceae bacterium]|nr:hypothetical protein [Planctomycetaceae bacterium]